VNLGEVEVKRRGRPPKVKEDETKVIDDMVEAVAAEPKKRIKYTFKSKYSDDKITLVKSYKTKNPDNSYTFVSGYVAEFDHNNWFTYDPKMAQKMRDMIEERKDINPLHVFETTDMD